MTPNQAAVLAAAQGRAGHGTIEDVMTDTGLDRRRVLAAARSLARNGQLAYRNHCLTPTR